LDPILVTIIRLLILSIMATGCVTTDGNVVGPSELSFESDDRQALMLEYSSSGNEIRPAVLMLHGASGFEQFKSLYEKHPTILVKNGYRVFAVMYYSDDDFSIMTGDDREARTQAYRQRLESWVQTTSDPLDVVSSDPKTDKTKIAVLGFSQGAYIAVGVAGTDHRVAAMVEKYGGLPVALAETIDELPPSLIIHGEADNVVPVSEARMLAKFMEEIGTKFEIVTYPNAGHGFDGRDGSEDADDSIRRTVDFIDNIFGNSPD